LFIIAIAGLNPIATVRAGAFLASAGFAASAAFGGGRNGALAMI
jgi:hypothetical protein